MGLLKCNRLDDETLAKTTSRKVPLALEEISSFL